MKQNLQNYATSQGISYTTAWRHFNQGKINNAFKDSSGKIFVDMPEQSVQSPVIITSPENEAYTKELLDKYYQLKPAEASLGEDNISKGSTRYNRAGKIEPFLRFENIKNSFLPVTTGRIGNKGTISISDMVDLTMRSYFAFSEVYNLINIATEFCTNNIFLRGGTKKSRDFFDALFRKINILSLQDRFYREFWRSGNVFIYKLLGKFRSQDLAKLTQIYGLSQGSSIKIPVKFIILNPADIICGDGATFSTTKYEKVLNDYEVAQLIREDKDEETKEIFDALPDSVKKELTGKRKTGGTVLLPLDPKKIHAVFLRKQDYEAFGVSMIWPVLDDLEWLSELIKIDRAIARTTQQAVLLITTGYQDKEGRPIWNTNTIPNLKAIFENQSVGRVLISDFSTKGEFLIPQIGDILDPKKYQIVRERIRLGLNDILMGGNEKFANVSIKVQVFVERLKNAQQQFLNEFLFPVIKEISREMNFKSFPTPHYEDVNLRDSVQFNRAAIQMATLGLLTQGELVEAVEKGKLPTEEESVENQRRYKQYREEGLYEPLVAKKDTEMEGRPPGSKSPQTTKKVTPIGQSKADDYFSVKKITDNLILFEKLKDKIHAEFKKKFKLAKLNDIQTSLADDIGQVIISNESPENWTKKIKDYISNPLNKNEETVNKINDIAFNHQVTDSIAAILFHSKRDKPDNV